MKVLLQCPVCRGTKEVGRIYEHPVWYPSEALPRHWGMYPCAGCRGSGTVEALLEQVGPGEVFRLIEGTRDQ